jgi:hypothetical protein
VGGSIAIAFTQDGESVSGDASFTGSPCFAGAHLEGSVRGRDLSGTLSAGAMRAMLSATVTATIDGTYTATQAGACSGDTGTFTLHR